MSYTFAFSTRGKDVTQVVTLVTYLVTFDVHIHIGCRTFESAFTVLNLSTSNETTKPHETKHPPTRAIDIITMGTDVKRGEVDYWQVCCSIIYMS